MLIVEGLKANSFSDPMKSKFLYFFALNEIAYIAKVYVCIPSRPVEKNIMLKS